MQNLCFLPGHDLLKLLRTRKVSAREVMEAHIAQIERVNPQVNAIVTFLPEQALEQADHYDNSFVAGESSGLRALPIVHKDLADTKGIRTTYGSPLFADHVPQQNALIVERLQELGITIGKSNTPEFGAGSQTFNEVFGRTLNPYDFTKTSGGSSGGAAAALACGMVPFADGSDMGGSLRNPAAFCNVVGFRPSPGRVPSWPKPMGWSSLAVEGPMARTVQDIAIMLSFMAGPDKRSPIALSESGSSFLLHSLERNFSGVKVAWSENLGGLPVEQEITKTINSQLAIFEQLGCIVELAEPKLDAADHIFKVLRAHAFALGFADLLSGPERGSLKESVIWNAESGLKLSALDIARAEEQRTLLYHEMTAFFDRYDFLLCPVTQVAPFDVTTEYPSSINNVSMNTYIDWMKSCYYITVLGFPAISIPCGFTESGLPVGLQIVGKHHADFSVLQLANAFEQTTGFWKKQPTIAHL